MGRIGISVPGSAISESVVQHIYWIKKVGDAVAAGDAVASVEASKGLVFIASPADGILCERAAAPGTQVRADDIIGYVEVG